MGNKAYPEDRSYRAWHNQQMQDPDYAREYEAQGPEFAAILKLIELRQKKGLSQKQLAEKAGTTQPSVARLESRKSTRNLNLLERMADALGHKVTVGVEPGKAPSRHRTAGAKNGALAKPLSKVPSKRSHAASRAKASRPNARRK